MAASRPKSGQIQHARVFEVTPEHYHVVTSIGRLYWIPKKHAVVEVSLDDLVELILRTERWHREWWIQSLVDSDSLN